MRYIYDKCKYSSFEALLCSILCNANVLMTCPDGNPKVKEIGMDGEHTDERDDNNSKKQVPATLQFYVNGYAIFYHFWYVRGDPN